MPRSPLTFLLVVVPTLLALGCAGLGTGTGSADLAACPLVDGDRGVCVLRRVPPQYPFDALDAGGEARVLVEFSVDESGVVRDAEAIALIGNDAFVEPTLRALRAWRYAPAMRDGVPVRQDGIRVAIPYRIGAIGGEPGARPNQRAALIKIFDAIERKDFEGGRQALTKIDAWKWPNLYEAGYRDFVHGVFAFADGDSGAAVDRLLAASRSPAFHVGEAGYRRSLIWLVRAANLAEQYGEALRAADELIAAAGVSLLPPDILKIRREVEVMRETDAAISRDITLGAAYGRAGLAEIRHVPLRRQIRLDAIGDSFLTTVRIGCDGVTEIREASVGMTIELQSDWADCSLDLYGVPGTLARVVELPAA